MIKKSARSACTLPNTIDLCYLVLYSFRHFVPPSRESREALQKGQMMTHPLYDLVRGADQVKKYLHVAGFKFPETVSAEDQAAIMAEGALMWEGCGGVEAGILTFVVRPNIDNRKGYTWGEVSVFADPEAFIRFHQHPVHKTWAEKIAKVADTWIVLDMTIDFELT